MFHLGGYSFGDLDKGVFAKLELLLKLSQFFRLIDRRSYLSSQPADFLSGFVTDRDDFSLPARNRIKCWSRGLYFDRELLFVYVDDLPGLSMDNEDRAPFTFPGHEPLIQGANSAFPEEVEDIESFHVRDD